MASLSITQLGNVTRCIATTELEGMVYYFWYADGTFLARTLSPEYTFHIAAGDQIRVACHDTNDADYDPIANAPDGWPARRVLWWIRSISTDVSHYLIRQRAGAEGDVVQIGQVKHDDAQWEYSFVTPRLTDLTDYYWWIVPVDDAGNEGSTWPESIELVRTPDAPKFSVSLDEDSPPHVTFAEAN